MRRYGRAEVELEGQLGCARFEAPVALSPEAMEWGLQDNARPPIAMLFPSSRLPVEEPISMWMAHNTNPLAMVWFDRRGVVTALEPHVRAGDYRTIVHAGAYCLEVSPEVVAGVGLRVGDRVVVTTLLRAF